MRENDRDTPRLAGRVRVVATIDASRAGTTLARSLRPGDVLAILLEDVASRAGR
jgi:hypothetical protein